MRRYPSKLLLFGEHVLLLGARALAVPVPAFSGEWAWRVAGVAEDAFVEQLAAFAQSPELGSVPGLQTDRFSADLREGLFFRSSIPVGYGLGSSGALCAAVYDQYVAEPSRDLSGLKQIFARMESFFHGQSSGIDPLTSYLNRGLWITQRSEVTFAETPAWQGAAPLVFLLDSGLPRQTGPLVHWFLEQSQGVAFAEFLEKQYLPAHAQVLEAWQSGRDAAFWPALQALSALQLEHLPPMVPANMRAIWKACLSQKKIALKICGAGGGGFVLGFAAERDTVLEIMSEFAPVFPFEQHGVVEK
ncbi:MAG: hypothetical protein IT260_03460 [Saprospiraceae bacterium]|nr:hypothetical protein [Saprospiraceae bacterium]